MDLVPESDLYKPLAPIYRWANPDGSQRKKVAKEEWGWARCGKCGAIQAKPISSRGGTTRVKATHRHCVLCGSRNP